MRSWKAWFAGAFAGLALCGPAAAQNNWPAKPVKIIVPFSAGTGLDVVARGFAERLAEQTKTTFTVENKEGAGGTIGAIAGARAPADGLTIVFTAHAPFAVAPYLQAGATYDPVGDFVPISKVALIPMVLITGSGSAFKKFGDVVAEVKTNPGKLSYASSGIGTPSHLHVEVIKRALGLDLVSVPYKNTGQAMSDVIGGTIPLYMPSLPAAQALLRSGQVRALAIGSAGRLPAYADIPTVAEVVNRPGLEATVWYGFLAPKGTPQEIVAQIHAEIAKAAVTPRVSEMLERAGAVATVVGPAEFGQQVKRDAEQSRQLLRALGVKPE